jgi:hypothetical protein
VRAVATPLALLCTAAALAACGSDPTSPPTPEVTDTTTPVAVALRLATGRDSTDVLLLTLAGPAVDSVTVPGGEVLVLDADATRTRVVIAGGPTSGVVATAWLPGATRRRGAPPLEVTLDQVADATTFAQRAHDARAVHAVR